MRKKMKRVLALVVALVMLMELLPTAAWADDEPATSGSCGIVGPDARWEFEPTTGVLTISGSGVVNLREATKYQDEWDNWEDDEIYAAIVAAIPWNNFIDEIDKVVIEQGITSTDGIFLCLKNLREIVFADNSVDIIDGYDFGCDVYSGLASLESVTLPNKFEVKNNFMYFGYDCPNFREFRVSPANQEYWSSDGVLFSGDVLIRYPMGKPGESYTIPEGVRSPLSHAFWNCQHLKTLILPRDMLSVYGFTGANGLENIILSEGSQIIGKYAFSDCPALKSITIPCSVTSIYSGIIAPDVVCDIYYAGSEEEWKQIDIDDDNAGLANATIHYNSGGNTPPPASGNKIESGTSQQIPQDGFAVLVVNESGDALSDVAVSVAGLGSETTGQDGRVVFGGMPVNKRADITINEAGYYPVSVMRFVREGGLAVVRLCPNDGKVHIAAVTGSRLWKTGNERTNITDLLTKYVYFQTDDGSPNVAEENRDVFYQIEIEAAGPNQISSYRLWQGAKLVAESNVAEQAFFIQEDNVTAPRIEKFAAGENVYVQIVDSKGQVSEKKRLGIKVAKPEVYADGGGGQAKGTIDLGSKVKFHVGDGIPILGGTDVELGFLDKLHVNAVFEVSDDGVVFVSVGYTGSGNQDKLNKEIVERNFKDALEKRAFEGQKVPFQASGLSVTGKIVGCGQGHIDKYGNITADITLVLMVAEEGSYTQYFFISFVPIYVTVGEKATLETAGGLLVERYNGQFSFTPRFISMEPKGQLYLDGGVGVRDVLHVGASGKAEVSWLHRWQDDYDRVELTGSMYLVAKAFLFKAEKKIAHGTWTLYDSNRNRSRSDMGYEQTVDFYDMADYVPIERRYLQAIQPLVANDGVVQAAVYPDAAPQLVNAGDKMYLFWLQDDATRADDDRTKLVYALSTDNGQTWSMAESVHSGEASADFSYDVCFDGTDLHVVLCKSKRIFNASGTTALAEMSAASEIYYGRLAIAASGAITPADLVQITDNAAVDMMPSIAHFGGRTVVAYAEGDELFGTGHVYYADVTDTDRITPILAADGAVTEVAIGCLNNQLTVAYGLDRDGDYHTKDSALYICSLDGSLKCLAEGAFSPSFAEGMLLWRGADNLYYTNDGANVLGVFAENSCPATLSNQFYVLKGSAPTVIWEASSESKSMENKPQTVVYAVSFNGGSWSKVYTLLESESELSSPWSGYTTADGDFVAYLQTCDIASETPQTDLRVVNITEPYVDMAVLGIDFASEDVEPGQNLAMTVTVKNNGGTPLKAFDIYIDDKLAHSFSGLALAAGAEEAYTFNYMLPIQLSGAQTFLLRVQQRNDSNQANDAIDFTLGYTDLAVEAERFLLGNAQWADVVITNNSAIASGATVQVLANSASGRVLYEKALSEVNKDTAAHVLLNLDELGADKSVRAFYFVAAADRTEAATADNTTGLYYEKNDSSVRYVLSVVAEKGGSVIGGGVYQAGETVTIGAIADDGYRFGYWSSSDGGVFADAAVPTTTFVMPDNDVVVTAHFQNNSIGGDYAGDYVYDSGIYAAGTDTASIRIEKSVHGTVSVDTANAKAGTVVLLLVQADTGYRLDSLVIKDKDGHTVEVNKKADKQYTFTMPNSPVTIQAIFVADALPFNDVDAKDWFYTPVKYVYDKKMMTGTDKDTFSPDLVMTRAMLVSILHRLEKAPLIDETVFSDVAKGQWYSAAVNWAASAGIVSGYEDGTFRADEAITREQLAAVLCRYAVYKGYAQEIYADVSRYKDVAQVSDYALASVKWAVAVGLLSGMDQETLVPQGAATRAQAAAMLMRLCEQVMK